MTNAMAVTYTPAADPEWLLVAHGRAALLFRATTTPGAAELLAALGSSDPVQSALDLLTRGGLIATPEFAMAAWSDETEGSAVLLARGSAVVRATASGGEIVLDGSGVSTWREHPLTGVTRIAIDAGGSRSETGSLGTLPLEAGVARATAAELLAGPTTTTAAESVAEPAARAPEPEPEPAPEPAPAPVVEATITELAEPETGGYSHLFEETIVRSIEDAAVRPPVEDEAEPATEAEPLEKHGDHDGMTIMSGDLAELRARSDRGSSSSVASSAAAPPAPPRFVLDISNGTTEPVAGPVLFGRSPSVAKVSSGQVPRLVSITGDQDISRNHAQFVLEGDTVVVTDLHSRNGTSIVLPGHAPQILRPGEPTPIISGTVVDLGGGTTMTLREDG
jgi:hypothetical protein